MPLRRLLARLRDALASDEDREERIEGSGDVILDPAYNANYEGERELKRMSEVARERDEE